MIQEQFKKLCEHINYKYPESFLKTVIEANKQTDKTIVNITFFNSPALLDLLEFTNKINHAFNSESWIFNYSIQHEMYSSKDVLEYLNYFAFKIIGKENYFNIIFAVGNFSLSERGELEIFYYSEDEEFSKNLEIIKNYVNEQMRKFGFSKFNMSIKSKEIAFDQDQEVEFANATIKPIVKENTNQYSKFKKPTSFYSGGYVPKSVIECYDTLEINVEINGFIIEKNLNKTKNDLYILTISISDYTEAIKIKKILKSQNDIELFYNNIEIDNWYKVQGKLTYDNYLKDKIINITNLTKIEKNKQNKNFIDNAPKKRVELSIKTSMSTMDGFKGANEFVTFAQENGYSAIAINDLNSAQAFPDFYNAIKKSPVKGIYGVSFNVLHKNNLAITNSRNNKNINEEAYVIFDIETTGLSPIFNEIIEFGAQKVVNKRVIEEIQFFIKPSKPIPSFITNLTNIKDSDVFKGYSEYDGLMKIKEFMDGFSVVAHNAIFDMSFINEKLQKNNIEPLNVQIVDTLIIARIVEPNSKKYRLENCAVRAGIIYDSSIAHRADYDADVLKQVWYYQIELLNKMGLNNFGDIYNYQSNSLYQHVKPFEITIIAKNKDGIKELFKLVSLSNTKNYFGNPILFIEDLPKSKNLLIGSGSSINSILINQILKGTIEKCREYIQLFDYIEIIPPKNFKHLIYREELDKSDVQKALKILIDLANKYNKIPVAVGDVKYIYESEKVFHEIYITAKGLQNSRHRLYKYNETEPKYPIYNFLSTIDMEKEFTFLNDDVLVKKIVIENSNYIANLIDNDIEIIKTQLYTPKIENSGTLLKDLVYKTAHEKYGEILPSVVESRIKRELEPIIKYGFDVIYWISHKLVKKSLEDGYLVGSRGSVGSSLVAYLSGITEVNPLSPHYRCDNCHYAEFYKGNDITSGFDLPSKKCEKCLKELIRDGQTIPFETFLGFDADKVPDIDLNFSGEYQNVIHNEVKKIFGEDHCFRAGTISTTAERTAYGYVMSWLDERGKEFSQTYKNYLASKILGTKRTTGQHPGGIIVIPSEFDVEDFTPINFPANDTNSSWKTTHFDFHAIHDNVLKLDLLGHDDPTAIKMLCNITKVNVHDIPFSDPTVIKLFSSIDALGIKPEDVSGETTGAMGIPEFGTTFVRRMLKKVKVTSFADLISISGLSHGTNVWTNNAELLVINENKSLKDLVSCRDDIMVYLMSKNIDGLKAFLIMEKVRKGKGLSTEEENLLKENNVPEWYIDSLKKIEYMFPKAHASAYVMMAWRIAWFKVYYPLEYYAIYLSTRADVVDIESMIGGKAVVTKKLAYLNANKNKTGPDKLSKKEIDLIPILEICEEFFARGFTIKTIDIEKSLINEWTIDHANKALLPPFISVDGLGISVADNIVRQRSIKPFISIQDFAQRTTINKTVLEKFKKINVFSSLEESNEIALF